MLCYAQGGNSALSVALDVIRRRTQTPSIALSKLLSGLVALLERGVVSGAPGVSPRVYLIVSAILQVAPVGTGATIPSRFTRLYTSQEQDRSLTRLSAAFDPNTRIKGPEAGPFHSAF